MIKKIKYEELAKTVHTVKSIYGSKYNILFSNHIDGTFDFVPQVGNNNFWELGSISLSILFFGISVQKSGNILEVKILTWHQGVKEELKERENEYIIYVVNDPSDFLIIRKDYFEKIKTFENAQLNDPLNTGALGLIADKLGLKQEYDDILSYEKLFYDQQKGIVNASSRYVEVFQIIHELNEHKSLGHNFIYKNKVQIAVDCFDVYFSNRFSFGIIILGVYLFSILANIGDVEIARKVFFKTLLYLNKQYEDFTSQIIKKYKEILLIKSSSIFNLDEYLMVSQNLEIDGKISSFVYGINLAAKYIESNDFDSAQVTLEATVLPGETCKNSEGVLYEDIYSNNYLISRLNNDESLNHICIEFSKIKTNHIIFAINYNFINFISGGKNKYVKIERSFKEKLEDSFYMFYYNIQRALIDGRKLPENIENEVDGILEHNATQLIEVIKKVKSLEHTSCNEVTFNDVKTLLIDFNIWDYLDI